MARKLTEQERESIEAMRAALNDALPPAQRGIASGIASSLVRKPGDMVTEEDLDRILGKYDEADELVRQAVKDTLLDAVEGQDGTFTVRTSYTAEGVSEDQVEASGVEADGDKATPTPGELPATAGEAAPDDAASSDGAEARPEAGESEGSAADEAEQGGGVTSDSPRQVEGQQEETATPVAPESQGEVASSQRGEAEEPSSESAPKPQRRARRARRTHKTAGSDKAKASNADGSANVAGAGKTPVTAQAAGEQEARSEAKPETRSEGKPGDKKAEKPVNHDGKRDVAAKTDEPAGKAKPGGHRRRGGASPKDDASRDLKKVPYVRRGNDDDAEVRQKIVALDKRFWMNGWLLSHPGAYTLYEPELLAINDALSDGMLPGDITRRQLAYQMGGDEKFFEYGNNGFRLLRAMGMEDVIRHRPTPKPDLVYHAPRRRKHMRVLVTENLDPYLDVHDLMYEDGRTTILGERIHAVVLGGGTPVLEHNRLALLLDTLGADSITVLYWGDIDRAGLDIMVKLKEELGDKYKFRAFTPAYQLMVDKAMERFPDPADNESTGQVNIEPADSSLLCDGLTEEAAEYARAVIDDCGLIPQEILTKRDL